MSDVPVSSGMMDRSPNTSQYAVLHARECGKLVSMHQIAARRKASERPIRLCYTGYETYTRRCPRETLVVRCFLSRPSDTPGHPYERRMDYEHGHTALPWLLLSDLHPQFSIRRSSRANRYEKLPDTDVTPFIWRMDVRSSMNENGREWTSYRETGRICCYELRRMTLKLVFVYIMRLNSTIMNKFFFYQTVIDILS